MCFHFAIDIDLDSDGCTEGTIDISTNIKFASKEQLLNWVHSALYDFSAGLKLGQTIVTVNEIDINDVKFFPEVPADAEILQSEPEFIIYERMTLESKRDEDHN